MAAVQVLLERTAAALRRATRVLGEGIASGDVDRMQEALEARQAALEAFERAARTADPGTRSLSVATLRDQDHALVRQAAGELDRVRAELAELHALRRQTRVMQEAAPRARFVDRRA